MSRARELADLSNVINKGANIQPNLIINSDMSVAQRGTSVTGLTNGSSDYHTVDRFRFVEGGTPTYQFTMSQSTTAPDGFGYSLKMDCTTAQSSLAAADQARIDYHVEAQDCQNFAYGTSSAKKLTLSFWVRSNKTGTYVVRFYQEDDDRQNGGSYTINAADTWEYKTITISGDTTGVIDNDNGKGLQITFVLATGTTYTSGTLPTSWEANTPANRYVGHTVNLADSTSNDWYITGVSLVVGDTAPVTHPYESYAENLKRCQRYYYFGGVEGGRSGVAAGYMSSSTSVRWTFTTPANMRASPTYSGATTPYSADGSNRAISSTSVLGISGNTVAMIGTVSGGSNHDSTTINYGSAQVFRLDAEL